MKKILTMAALACAAMAANAAEPVVYDFNTTPLFFSIMQSPIDEGGYGITGNFDFIKKTGEVGVPYGVGAGTGDLLCTKLEDGTWVNNPDLKVRISLSDGVSYALGADGRYMYDAFELDQSAPFIGYGPKGPTRVVWMAGWGSLDAWADANYNAATEADWVSSKHALAFNRNDNSASRTDTYVQFPEFQGPFNITYYIASVSDTNRNKEQPLKCKVVPVKNDEELTDYAQLIDVPYEKIMDKRYYKYVYNYTGNDKVSTRIGANGAILALFHVEFNEGYNEAGLENVIAPAEELDAPVYNIMGQRVGQDYKGLVIKNGVKYIQK